MKCDLVNNASDSGTAVKPEGPLPYLQQPSVDPQQTDQQSLPDSGTDIELRPVVADGEADPQALRQPSNVVVVQGQVFGEKDQECKSLGMLFGPYGVPTDRTSSRLWRVESRSKSVPGYAQLPSILYV